MISLGVDPSTKTGVAVVNGGKVLHTSRIEAKGLTGLHRAGHIAAQLMSVIERNRPDLVVFEGYGYANTHTLVTLVEIGTVLRYFVTQSGLEYVDVPPTSLKKFVTGKGNAKKETMILETYKRFDVEVATNDEADAIGLAMFGQALLGKVMLPKSHMEAVDKLAINCQKVLTKLG